MGTSSAHPGELEAYASGLVEPADAVQRAIGRFEDALAALDRAVEGRLGSTTVPSQPLARVRELDGSVAVVAARFRAVDGSATVVVADDGALGPPLPVAYSAEVRARLAEEAADEYADLAEDDGDPTTAQELAGYLDLIRAEVDAAGEGLPAAEAFEARKRRAEELLAQAGPRDLFTALGILEGDIEAGGTGRDRARSTLDDLGAFLSLGLEDDPARAQEWFRVLGEEWSWDGDDHSERGELLALLATQVDGGTRTLGELAFWELFDNPVNARLDNDLLVALTGDPSPFTAMFAAFADTPRLANAIVDRGLALRADGEAYRADLWDMLLDWRYDGWENDGSREGDPRYQDSVAAFLLAATDPSLLPEERVWTAAALLRYFESRTINGHDTRFSEPVRHVIGQSTLPLLEAWVEGSAEQLKIPGTDIPLADDDLAVLQRTIERLAGDGTGAVGLLWATDQLTQSVIHQAITGGTPNDLDKLGDVLYRVIGTTAEERYDALRDAVRGGGGAAAVEAMLAEGIGAIPTYGPAVKAIYEGAKAYIGEQVAGGGTTLPFGYTEYVRYQLALAHLDAGFPLPEGAEADLATAAERGGPGEVVDLILDDPRYAGLADVVRDGFDRIDPRPLETIDAIFAD